MIQSSLIYTISKFKIQVSALLFWIVLLACLGLASGGCQQQSVHPPEKKQTALHQARQDFLNGRYHLAKEKFNALIKQTDQPQTVDAALWCLSCVSMATANDVGQFYTTLDSLLHDEAGMVTRVGTQPENFKLLIKALEHGSHLVKKEQKKNKVKLTALKVKKAGQSKEIHKLQQLVKTLQHQISTLESIDQDLQEKRKKQ